MGNIVSSSIRSRSGSESSQLPSGVSILWLDTNAKKDFDDMHATESMLRQLHSSVFIYTDVEPCLEVLKSIKNKQTKIFLVVSGRLSSAILPNLDTYPSIDSVFIFCRRRQKYEHLIDQYKPHLIDVLTDHNQLVSSLKRELDAFQLRQSGLTFFAQKQSATRDLTYDAASFLWFQLLQSMLIQGKYDGEDKTFMLNYCRQHYARDRAREKFNAQIEEFDKTYSPSQAIKWYTKDSFLYRLVNAALRTEDVEALWIFRFFIADLCRQLVVQHKIIQDKKREAPVLTLYRGCRLPREEVEKLAELIGGMTSLNGFVSTSYKRALAEQFMEHSSRQSDPQKVLFTIKADSRLDKVVFANVGAFSEYPDEEEILFSLGSAFLINRVELNHATHVWHIQMTATDVGAKAAADYIKLIQQELTDSSIMIIFGQLLIDMGKYITAQKYFSNLLERFHDTDHSDLGDIHYNLGLTYTFQKDLSEAERHLWKAYEYQKLIVSKKRDVVRSRNALGWVYQDNGELRTAMDFYLEAEKIGKQTLGSDHLTNAQTYSNMGSCYLERGNFDNARNCYGEALRILQKHLPSDHPRVGVILNDLANVSRKETDTIRAKTCNSTTTKSNDWTEILNLYQQAEHIFCSNLPVHHPCTAYCWSCMGFLYLRENEIDQARHYHEKALKSYRRSLPANHINIHISEQNLNCHNYQRINDSYLRVCSQT